jgi:carboxypeptidase PM20D1
MFEDLCPYTPFLMRILFANLWFFGPVLKRVIPKINAQAGSMLGTSCTFFEIEGTYESKECVAKATLRCVDDKDQEADLDNIKKIAKKYGVEITDGDYNEYHAPADMNSSVFKYTKDCIAHVFPHVASAAYILPAGTDARHLSEICPCVIRFAPIEMNNQQFASVHSENENINVSAIGNAVAFYKYYVENYK